MNPLLDSDYYKVHRSPEESHRNKTEIILYQEGEKRKARREKGSIHNPEHTTTSETTQWNYSEIQHLNHTEMHFT